MTSSLVELHLKTALATAPYTRALKDGAVTSDRVTLDFVEISRIQDAFPRMVREQTYDVSQMSPTTYLVARSFNKPVTAIPVFLNRHFHHDVVAYNVSSGIRTPKDLEGKRVGIGSWTITTGVWGRVMLQDLGVDLEAINYVSFEDPHVAEYREPAIVTRAPAGKTLNGMLATGELDAAIAAGIQESEQVKRLIPDTRSVEEAWYRRTGIYPIVHTVVVKDALLQAHPWLGGELFRMFTEAKDRYLDALCKRAASASGGAAPAEGMSSDEERILWQSRVLNGDPLPYGVEPNRRSLEALIGACLDQRIIPTRLVPDHLFVSSPL